MDIFRVVLLFAANLDLFESPLRQDRISSPQVTPEMHVPEPQPGRQRMNFLKVAFASPVDVVHDLDLPMILYVTNRLVSVAGYFVVEFGDGSWDRVGVQVSRCSRMSHANNVAILDEPQRSVEIISRFVPPWQNDPVIVFILIMITSDLLLHRSNRERLHVGVK